MNSQQLRSHAELCRKLAEKFAAGDIRQVLDRSVARYMQAAAQFDLARWHWSDNEPS